MFVIHSYSLCQCIVSFNILPNSVKQLVGKWRISVIVPKQRNSITQQIQEELELCSRPTNKLKMLYLVPTRLAPSPDQPNNKNPPRKLLLFLLPTPRSKNRIQSSHTKGFTPFQTCFGRKSPDTLRFGPAKVQSRHCGNAPP